MRRGLAVLCAGVLAVVAPADTPLPALMGTATGPERMYSLDMSGSAELPPYFAEGRETGLTVVAWVRFAPELGNLGLICFPTHSTVPARATREGGDELPAFLDLASVPYGSGATWGASGVVPQDAAEVPGAFSGRFVVCVNCATDTAITLTVGGAELNIPATNDFVRNLEVVKGDASVAVSAAAAGARTSLALAVNPWIQFFNGPTYTPAVGQELASAITNCWTMLCWRADLSGGTLAESFDLITRDGTRDAVSSSSPYPAAAFVRDSRFRYSLACLGGMVRGRLDVYGLKYIRGRIDDADVWRIWELDLAEIRRRGLDTALPIVQ